jgi:hypothetical protein
MNASGASNGSEADGSLAAGMMGFRLKTDGTILYVEINNGGTIKTGSLALV